jgi:hypothetical protein
VAAAADHPEPGPLSRVPEHSSCPPLPGERRKQVSPRQALGRVESTQNEDLHSTDLRCLPASEPLPSLCVYTATSDPSAKPGALLLSLAALFASVFTPKHGLSALPLGIVQTSKQPWGNGEKPSTSTSTWLPEKA